MSDEPARRHRWLAIVPYELTPEDAERMVYTGPRGAPEGRAADDPPALDDVRPFLGTHNIVHDLVSVGCYACEAVFTREIAEQPCPGQAPGELAYVEGDRIVEETRTPVVGNAGARGALRGVARNDPCPCGSGKKYKRCHGAPA